MPGIVFPILFPPNLFCLNGNGTHFYARAKLPVTNVLKLHVLRTSPFLNMAFRTWVASNFNIYLFIYTQHLSRAWGLVCSRVRWVDRFCFYANVLGLNFISPDVLFIGPFFRWLCRFLDALYGSSWIESSPVLTTYRYNIAVHHV